MRASLTLFALLAACASPASCPPVEITESSAGSEEPERPAIQFTVEEGSLGEVARMLARAIDRPVVVGPDAVVVADCVLLSMFGTELMTRDQVVRLVASSLEGSGIELARTQEGMVFRRVAGGELPRCVAPRPRATEVVEAPSPQPQPPPDEDGVLAQVRAGLDQGNRTLSRRALNHLLSNQAVLMRTARLIPHEENGRVVGIRVYGIRRDSLLGLLGFENGDLVTRVNGYAMTSPDTALEAYAALPDADSLVVELMRRGTPVTLRWRLVE